MNRKEYEERIAKLEKELKELKETKIEDDEFPRLGDQYWFVSMDGYVVYACWGDNSFDNYRKDFLRIFKTKKECERYLEIQKAFKEESKKFEPNWKDDNQNKYCLYYDYEKNSVKIGWNTCCRQPVLYFESKKVLEELIERFGEDDVKKYYCGIEEQKTLHKVASYSQKKNNAPLEYYKSSKKYDYYIELPYKSFEILANGKHGLRQYGFGYCGKGVGEYKNWSMNSCSSLRNFTKKEIKTMIDKRIKEDNEEIGNNA